MTQQTDLTQAFRPLLTWLSRHVTTQYFIAGMTTVLFLVAWNRGIALLYGMVALLIAILAISYLLPHMGMRKLSVRLSGTHRCQHGGTLTFPIQLNSGSACRHIGISLDAFPDAIVTERPAFVSYVDGDSSANLRVSCHLRGEYRIEQLRACSSYPFGIHRACREVECNGASLLVHPRLFPLRELPYLGSSMQSSFGERSVHSINHYEDYAGAREYRHGDNPRHIHWAASARHRSLIVREFESHDLPALLIVVNCDPRDNVGTPPNTSFETGIEIAASMMQYAATHGVAVELVADGSRGFNLSLPAGRSLQDNHLDQFARMRADANRDYRTQVDMACRRFARMDTIVTFSLDSDESVPAVHGRQHIAIRFERGSFEQPGVNIRPGQPIRRGNTVIYPIRCGDALDRVFDARH